MSVKVVQGDLFSHICDLPSSLDAVVIAHVANNRHIAGAGFILPLFHNFPVAKTAYEESSCQLGTNSYATAGKVMVANMVAQDGFPDANRRRAVHYGHLARCMVLLALELKANRTSFGWKNIEIHVPRLGSGLGGGDSRLVEEFMESLWSQYPVTIYELPAATGAKSV